MEWMDIKTAPRDGTRIDIWANGRRRADAYWGKRRSWTGSEECCWHPYDGMNENPPEPTHWMPLPPPPLDELARKEAK